MSEIKGNGTIKKCILKSKTQRAPSPHPILQPQDGIVEYAKGASPAQS